MLNFFTTSNGFRSTLPVVSNLTAMNVWDGVCMCCIYASLLEFVLVNYVGRKRSDWPLPIVYQNKDQDYKQIAQVRIHITEYTYLVPVLFVTPASVESVRNASILGKSKSCHFIIRFKYYLMFFSTI